MSMEELEKLLTRKERLFVEEYDRDGNGTQAAIRAGYSPGKKNASASVQASKLLRSAKISAYRRARANELCSQMGISRETIKASIAASLQAMGVDPPSGTTLEQYAAQLAAIAAAAPWLSLTGGTMTGPIVLNGPPTDENHAANKQYVDGLVGDINAALDAINGEVV